MFEKPCRCGASKKNFNIDIGPFFVDDCCLKAGYDELGNKVENTSVFPTPVVIQETVVTANTETGEVLTQTDVTPPTQLSEKELKALEKERKKQEKAAAKAAAKAAKTNGTPQGS